MVNLDSVWKELNSGLKQANESAPGKVTALCPAHNDKNPSLSVTLTDPKIFLKCHAGCSFTAIVSALNMNSNQFTAKKPKPKKRSIIGYNVTLGVACNATNIGEKISPIALLSPRIIPIVKPPKIAITRDTPNAERVSCA